MTEIFKGAEIYALWYSRFWNIWPRISTPWPPLESGYGRNRTNSNPYAVPVLIYEKLGLKVLASLFRILFILLSAFIGCSKADIVRSESGDFYEAEFIVVNKGRSHWSYVLMAERDMSREDCQMLCIQHLKCKSINYNAKERMCEVVDSDDIIVSLVEEVPDWVNYATPPRRE